MFITPATKKTKKPQKTTAFYTYHTDSVKLAASMKLEFFFQPNDSRVNMLLTIESVPVIKN